MNTTHQTQLRSVSARDWHMTGQYLDRATRVCQLGHEIVQEIWDTVGGIFAMPLAHLPHDKFLDRLNDDVLRDIGYERAKGPKFDNYF